MHGGVDLGVGVDVGGGHQGDEPPSSRLRPAPKQRLAVCRAATSRPPSDAADAVGRGMGGTGQAGEAVDQEHHVVAGLGHALGPGDGQLEHGDVLVGRRVERRAVDGVAGDHVAHLGDLLGALVEQDHDEGRVGLVDLDRAGDGLQQRGLAVRGGASDQDPAALADGRQQVDGAGGAVVGARRRA